MQFFALDENHALVFANGAIKQKNYLCNECRGVIRLRRGLHRQPHFYHLRTTKNCRLSGKGMVHLQVQMNLLNLLPVGECQLEYRMPEIQRIADVVWIPKKLVFEIQCSPISSDEVMQRNRDYQQLGWQVIWILHDHRYNQSKLSAAEFILRQSPHYFTNIDQDGRGVVYDQISVIQRGVRKQSSKPLTVDLSQPQTISSIGIPKVLPYSLKERMTTWSYMFANDLINSFLNSSDHDEFFQFHQISYQIEQPKRFGLKGFIYHFFLRPYRLVFQLLLEKACR